MHKNNAASAVMLTLNITPDSFSDGGVYANDLPKIMAKVEQSLADGVTCFDIGAESTRPNAELVSAQEEIARLTPVIKALCELKQKNQLQISIDSYKSETISHFLPQIDIVNDVSNKLPLELVKQITDSGKKYVLMHSLTVPANPSVNVEAHNVTAELLSWFSDKLKAFTDYGIKIPNIILDLGIGFNKTADQSWLLLRYVSQFKKFGCELLIGHSRKRFLDSVTDKPFANRDLETATISKYLYDIGTKYIRMHEYHEFLLMANIHLKLSGK
jgi:dihydropteroate synthase